MDIDMSGNATPAQIGIPRRAVCRRADGRDSLVAEAMRARPAEWTTSSTRPAPAVTAARSSGCVVVAAAAGVGTRSAPGLLPAGGVTQLEALGFGSAFRRDRAVDRHLRLRAADLRHRRYAARREPSRVFEQGHDAWRAIAGASPPRAGDRRRARLAGRASISSSTAPVGSTVLAGGLNLPLRGRRAAAIDLQFGAEMMRSTENADPYLRTAAAAGRRDRAAGGSRSSARISRPRPAGRRRAEQLIASSQGVGTRPSAGGAATVTNARQLICASPQGTNRSAPLSRGCVARSRHSLRQVRRDIRLLRLRDVVVGA